MNMRDSWFFVGVFIFIFVIWIATGGPLQPINFTIPSIKQPGVSLGSGTYFYNASIQLPQARYKVGNSRSTLLESSGTNQDDYSLPMPTPSITGGVFGLSSPYRSVVRVNHSVSGAGSSDPKNEYIIISVSQNAGTAVNISGWTLKSDSTGASSVIPKGTEVPTSGVVNATEDIILTPGKRAFLISGISPIGASFRENKCIGYFSTFQQFRPSLPRNCPLPSDELIARYGPGYIHDTSCIEYVKKISRCEVALSPPVNLSNACQNFTIQYLNYNGCVNAHKNDTNFMGDTWRVYLGRTSPLWRTKYEIVKLLDADGKTVDAFSY